MSELRIITDHKWKQFKYRDEVPAKVLEKDFDYQNAEDAYDGFFCYRKIWYHIDQFMCIDKYSPFVGWDGYSSDSFFSGVLIKLSADGEEYQVGTYMS